MLTYVLLGLQAKLLSKVSERAKLAGISAFEKLIPYIVASLFIAGFTYPQTPYDEAPMEENHAGSGSKRTNSCPGEF